ncbi:YheC/YheD family protein [Paenibacillus sp. YN15]|uniref:YheC/YheD family endospore coat-associated protein n=1 Tax=Paenibacillus sp. YN15 TaxID=1742774 RepID=UPI000DCDCB36|nr:YheC/YheD family protein [Paenibacillus sp. YN15]RAV06559.1 YheC/YheD family protein [Paenibacillus sp. YN15]
MAKIKLPVYLQFGSAHPEEHIAIGAGFLKKLKLPLREPVTLRFGSTRKEVRIVQSNQASLRMSAHLAASLAIPHGTKLCVSYHPASRTLHIGPLIGVLMSRVYTQAPDRPFGAMTAFCAELTEACRLHGGMAYFFTPNDITGNSDLRGWMLSEGRWVKSSFPYPNVMYNRVTSRKLENKPQVQQFMRDLKARYGSVAFNEKYLDKTEVFQALRKEKSVHAYLPESYLFKNFAMLKSMCKKYNTVFLKPITGSLGKGIIRISSQPEGGGYQCSFSSLSGIKRQHYPTLTQLFQSISGKMKQRRYQIQQGLRLMETGGRPVDFRALVQKNGDGEWAVTSVVARVAASNTFVSNLARGGTLSPVSEAVARSNLPSGVRASVNTKLRTAALSIAKSVDSTIDGHFAELGVDLAVDAAGRVWLLEVNSKPSKEDNTPSGDSKIRPSVKQVVLYSQHAWGK